MVSRAIRTTPLEEQAGITPLYVYNTLGEQEAFKFHLSQLDRQNTALWLRTTSWPELKVLHPGENPKTAGYQNSCQIKTSS
jgi:hypothetical protein